MTTFNKEQTETYRNSTRAALRTQKITTRFKPITIATQLGKQRQQVTVCHRLDFCEPHSVASTGQHGAANRNTSDDGVRRKGEHL